MMVYNNIMSIKAVIFDADGMTIKRSEYFSARLARVYNIPADKILPFFKGEFQDCLVGKADLKEKIAPYLSDWNWKGTVEDLLDYWFRSEADIDQQMIEEIIALRKKGIRCYLATNQEKYRLAYLRNNLGFEQIFNGIYSSSEMGCKKPEKDFYEFIFSNLNKQAEIKPEEIMFWDNEEENIAPVKSLGWQGYVYKSFEEFQKIIAGI